MAEFKNGPSGRASKGDPVQRQALVAEMLGTSYDGEFPLPETSPDCRHRSVSPSADKLKTAVIAHESPPVIQFSKEEVPSRVGTIHSSPLADQIKRFTANDRAYTMVGGRSSGYARPKFRCTVYLPFTERDDFVQVEVPADCSAKSLATAALAMFKAEGGQIPSKEAETKEEAARLWDASKYKLYIAEEDGELDMEFPNLDDSAKVSHTGVDSFALVRKEHSISVSRTSQSFSTEIADTNDIPKEAKPSRWSTLFCCH